MKVSLERTLIGRLCLTLIITLLVMAGWLWAHLALLHDPAESTAELKALTEHLSNAGWVVPFAILAVFGVTAMTVRQSLKPLNRISNLAAQIRPRSLNQRLPTSEVPTEIIPFIAAINQMLEGVEKGFLKQKQFAENAAHELRTPLQILSAGLDELEQTDKIETLKRDLERMTRSVEQILALSRLDARPAANNETAELNGAAVNVLTRLAPLASRQSVDLSLDKAETAVTVAGNAWLIEDLLRNLVENAIAASPEHGRVSVNITANGAIEVVDQGLGIPEIYKMRVFERFWHLPNEKRQGSGLGLAIAKNIATHFGATISILDNPGGGSIFRIDFVQAK